MSTSNPSAVESETGRSGVAGSQPSLTKTLQGQGEILPQGGKVDSATGGHLMSFSGLCKGPAQLTSYSDCFVFFQAVDVGQLPRRVGAVSVGGKVVSGDFQLAVDQIHRHTAGWVVWEADCYHNKEKPAWPKALSQLVYQ